MCTLLPTFRLPLNPFRHSVIQTVTTAMTELPLLSHPGTGIPENLLCFFGAGTVVLQLCALQPQIQPAMDQKY
jgi:hypothetical protein